MTVNEVLPIVLYILGAILLVALIVLTIKLIITMDKIEKVVDNITVEICSNCHPFYTGQQKILDSEGRVERFKKRYGTK